MERRKPWLIKEDKALKGFAIEALAAVRANVTSLNVVRAIHFITWSFGVIVATRRTRRACMACIA